MTLSPGDRLPAATFIELGDDGPTAVSSDSLTSNRRVVIFAVPGAYTRVCSAQHLPSFIRSAEGFAAKGVDEIVCVAVNDPFVLAAWREASGAGRARIRMLADASGAFTKAIGMDFTNPSSGLFGRSKRYAMLVEDGVVRVFNAETSPGACEISAGEALLAAI